MTRFVRTSSASPKNRVFMTAVIAGFMLALPSCRLPKLCCAEKGPAMPETFNGETSAESVAQIGWSEFFEDPVLAGLIDQSLVGNQELKILAQEVRIANLEIMSRQGEYLPFVNIGASAGIDKSGTYTRAGAVEENLLADGKAFPDPLPNFLVAADISWEIDIWKKLRNAKNAAALRYLGTRDGQNYVVTRLVAEVSDSYYELLALDNQLLTVDRTIEIQEKSLEIAKAKKKAARGTELAVQRFEAEVRKNQSERLIIQQEIVETENQINFLLGRFPQPVSRSSEDYINLRLHALDVGVPSQLLQNRADIRQAERQLQAAGLDVKVARARFYPSLTLTAGVGYEAFNTRYLFLTPQSLIYNAVGELTAPLINKKAIKADYLSANAAQIQAVYNYQRTVLNAYTEVINHLTKVDNYGQSIEIKKQQLAALEASVDSATKLFQNARAEYVEVLLAQRDMMEARLVLIETKREQLVAVVNAYQSLGGGSYGGGGFMISPNSPQLQPAESPEPNGEVPAEEMPVITPNGEAPMPTPVGPKMEGLQNPAASAQLQQTPEFMRTSFNGAPAADTNDTSNEIELLPYRSSDPSEIRLLPSPTGVRP